MQNQWETTDLELSFRKEPHQERTSIILHVSRIFKHVLNFYFDEEYDEINQISYNK